MNGLRFKVCDINRPNGSVSSTLVTIGVTPQLLGIDMRTRKQWAVCLARDMTAIQNTIDLPDGLRWVQHNKIILPIPKKVKDDKLGCISSRGRAASLHRVMTDPEFKERLTQGWKIYSLISPSGREYLI